ncbi:hypothetical protein CN387_26975 [Bacillus cereus]|nr:hypothetical protein CON08_28895 [Bacillus cereus]PEE56517.1 hypothetical protein COM68_23940 [Bacillus cereus]PET06778.1 hypothetical protein CN513_29360 [Bacillus cereus]PET27865.1 hypothetical protein CN519_14035 [Bacillus cereus]PEU35130.1 hypothetical protein CN387_26975 [Bacillus cereus]
MLFVCIFRDGRAYIGMCGWKPIYISEHLSIMGVLLLCKHFNILAKKTSSSRRVKDQSLVSRWEMDWLRTWDGRKPS